MKAIYDWAKAKTLYDEGKTDREIAVCLGCTYGAVVLWRKNLGLVAHCPSNIHRIPKEIYETIRPMIESGESLRDIADKTGVHIETIRKFAIRNKLHIALPPVKMRPQIVGGTLDRQGYVMLRVAVDSEYGYLIRANTRDDAYGYAPLHRMRMHDKLGRRLLPNEVVHHIDGDIYNNSLANLAVYESNGEHLADSLKGKTPGWTAEGWNRICSPKRKRRQKD